MQAAGSSETSALVSPPCVTAGNFTASLIRLRGMRGRPVQRLMTQFQGISDSTCVTHAAVWLARYCAGILYLGGRPHSCRQMYAVRSTATRPHLSWCSQWQPWNSHHFCGLASSKFVCFEWVCSEAHHLAESITGYVCDVESNRSTYYSVKRCPSHWRPYRRGDRGSYVMAKWEEITGDWRSYMISWSPRKIILRWSKQRGSYGRDLCHVRQRRVMHTGFW
jgi:hypothetical protein